MPASHHFSEREAGGYARRTLASYEETRGRESETHQKREWAGKQILHLKNHETPWASEGPQLIPTTELSLMRHPKIAAQQCLSQCIVVQILNGDNYVLFSPVRLWHNYLYSNKWLIHCMYPEQYERHNAWGNNHTCADNQTALCLISCAAQESWDILHA